MINLNDPFYGLMAVLLSMIIIFGYIAIFGKVVDDEPKKHSSHTS
jgi:hypothetical protein